MDWEDMLMVTAEAKLAGWSFRKFRDTLAHNTGLSIKKIEKMYFKGLEYVLIHDNESKDHFLLKGWEMFVPEIEKFVNRNTSGRC